MEEEAAGAVVEAKQAESVEASADESTEPEVESESKSDPASATDGGTAEGSADPLEQFLESIGLVRHSIRLPSNMRLKCSGRFGLIGAVAIAGAVRCSLP